MTETNASFRILVIDDEAFSRRMAAGLFTALGAGHVVSASSAGEARAMMAADPTLSLILSDHYMPDGSGLRLLADLRQGRLPLAYDSYFIVATASTSGALAAVALALDTDSFISKPVGKEDLARRLYEFLVLKTRSIKTPLHYRDLDVNGMLRDAESNDPAAPRDDTPAGPMTSIGRILPDTPLAADLRIDGGRILLPAGTALTRHLLLRLSELGIDEVPVGANPLDSAAAARRAALAEHAKTEM